MTNSIAFTIALLACLVLVGCARHLNDPGWDVSLPDKGHVVLANQRFSLPDWPQALYADVYIPDGNIVLMAIQRRGRRCWWSTAGAGSGVAGMI